MPDGVVGVPAQGVVELPQGNVAPQVNPAPQGPGEVERTLRDCTNIEKIYFRVGQTTPNFP